MLDHEPRGVGGIASLGGIPHSAGRGTEFWCNSANIREPGQEELHVQAEMSVDAALQSLLICL